MGNWGENPIRIGVITPFITDILVQKLVWQYGYLPNTVHHSAVLTVWIKSA